MKTKLIGLSILASTYILAWTNATDVSGGSGKNFFPQIISDGSNGAIISWLHRNSYGCYEVYGARVQSSGGVSWRTENISRMNLTGSDVGHRLNHHIIPSTSNSVIYFWANHFNAGLSNPGPPPVYNYPRGYYLQKTNGSGALQWLDPDDPYPVLVQTTYPVPEPKDGDPISICPDGAGGCVVAMRQNENAWVRTNPIPWIIQVVHYDATGGIVGTLTTVYDNSSNHMISCPKIVPFNETYNGTNYEYVVAFVTADNTGDTLSNSTVMLHLLKVRVSGGTIEFEDYAARQETYSTDPDYFYWYPDFELATNSSNNILYAAYTKYLKLKTPSGRDTQSVKHTQQYVCILRYASQSSTNTNVGLWPESGISSTGCVVDNLPFRAPTITCVGNDAIICFAKATDTDPTKVPGYRKFDALCYKMTSSGSSASKLWQSSSSGLTNPHNPCVIAAGSSGYVICFSDHSIEDYYTSKLSILKVWRFNSLTGSQPSGSWSYPGGLNCSPEMVLSDENHFIVTWGSASGDGKPWTILVQRLKLKTDGTLGTED